MRPCSCAAIGAAGGVATGDGQLWLRQATDDYRFGSAALAGRFYAQACFVAQQVAGKATKAVHYELTGRPVIEPSVQTLLRRLNARTTVTDELVGLGGQLDQYYVSTVMGPRRLRHTVPPASRHALRPPLEDRCIEPTRDLDPEDALAAPLAALVRHIGDAVPVTVDAKNDVLHHRDDARRAAPRTCSGLAGPPRPRASPRRRHRRPPVHLCGGTFPSCRPTSR